jgi:predicted lipid-binding transport protein (Tim44 family)
MSIAGARLSHLVQKDKIWDHGSMTEQVKNVFYQVEKAKNKKDTETVKKYLTARAFEQLEQLMLNPAHKNPLIKNAVLSEVWIIDVTVATIKTTDRFTAIIKGKGKMNEEMLSGKKNYGIENFSEKWFFVREGEWWLLDHMKSIKIF